MRARIVLGVLIVAGLAAGSAHATARPLTTQDKTLLARPATYEEKIAEAVAGRLTGHTTSVRCGPIGESSSQVLGVTPFLGSHALDYFLMRPAECTYLTWFHQAPSRWDPRTCTSSDCDTVGDIAIALAVVAHESYHILGYVNEARVECYGMQSIWYVANKLGAPVPESEALASWYATQYYPRRRTQTPTYWSAECRDGGKYDLRPKSRSWPS
jgi:hypothetical protein